MRHPGEYLFAVQPKTKKKNVHFYSISLQIKWAFDLSQFYHVKGM